MTISTKILLVESDELNRDMLTRRLERRGFEVLTAGNGQAAVEMSQSAWPALIILELSLPGLNGWEAARLIKENPLTENIPLIALTAHVRESESARALKMGCDAVQTKPVDIDALMVTIRRLLAGR